MDIKEFEKHTKAWSAFEKWCSEGNTMLNWDKMKGDTLDEREIRCLLADLQAWLDSVGIYADVLQGSESYFEGDFDGMVSTIDKHFGCVATAETRPEALFAAISKGLEIYETQTT